jgi:enterochelin esterase-like enzyme
VTFTSRALHERRGYLVHLPAGYSTRRRYPVLYLLHSAVGWPERWIVAAHADRIADAEQRAGRTRPLILVMPEGNVSRHGADTEWANTRLGPYEDAFVDVVRDVDRRFSTLRDRRARMLAGVSTGGFAAANLALRRPALFGGFESWSGYFRETASDAFAAEPAASLAANSPVDYVAALAPAIRRLGMAGFVYEGDREPDASYQDLFCARLRRAGGRVTCTRYAGGHGWTLWRAHLPAMLRFASARMEAPRP